MAASTINFAVKCPCGTMAAIPIPASQIDDDPAAIFRSMDRKDQEAFGDFMAEHKAHGDVVPCVVGFGEMAKV